MIRTNSQPYVSRTSLKFQKENDQMQVQELKKHGSASKSASVEELLLKNHSSGDLSLKLVSIEAEAPSTEIDTNMNDLHGKFEQSEPKA